MNNISCIIVLDLICLNIWCFLQRARPTFERWLMVFFFIFSYNKQRGQVNYHIAKKGVINKKRINQKDKIDCNKDFGLKHFSVSYPARSFMHYLAFTAWSEQLDRKQTSHLVKLLCYYAYTCRVCAKAKRIMTNI